MLTFLKTLGLGPYLLLLRIAAVAAVAAVVFYAGWRINGNIWQAEYDARERAYEKAAAAAQKAEDDRVAEANAKIASLDEKYTKGLADLEAVNDGLRKRLAAGGSRVRVNATCAVRHDDVQKAGTARAVGDEGVCTLGPAGRDALLRKQSQINWLEAAVKYLQDYALTCQK